ncbi:MAG TPA: hypothetical protein VIM58_01610 [Candidatus Methylacidiphilales bacterium]
MSEKTNAKAKPAPKGGKPAKGKGKGKGGGNALSWIVLAALAAGLVWVVVPFFSPLPPATSAAAKKETPQEMRQIATQHPEAEVFNPEGKETPGEAVKKK